MITVLTDIVFSECLMRAGVVGRNVRSNTRSVSVSGYATINANWAKTQRQYEFGVVPMSLEQWEAIEGLFEATSGGAFGFLMLDPKDQFADFNTGKFKATDGTVGFGYGVPSYQLQKIYTAGTRTATRTITRPKSPIVCKRGAATLVEGVSAGNIVVNYNTGVITFTADESEAIDAIVVGTTTKLDFGNSPSLAGSFTAGQRIYITGVTGTAGAVLNDKSHLIDTLTDTTMFISTNTLGLVADNGTGVGYKYPQITEALTWAGTFYVPVHFANDNIDWEILAEGNYTDRVIAGQSVVLQEIKE